MGFRLRVILWTPALAYEAFLLSGGSAATPAQIATVSFFGRFHGFPSGDHVHDQASAQEEAPPEPFTPVTSVGPPQLYSQLSMNDGTRITRLYKHALFLRFFQCGCLANCLLEQVKEHGVPACTQE